MRKDLLLLDILADMAERLGYMPTTYINVGSAAHSMINLRLDLKAMYMTDRIDHCWRDG